MQPGEVLRTATFRLTLAVVVAMIGTAALQFAVGYSQTKAFEFRRTDELLHREATLLAPERPQDLEHKIGERATDDLRVVINQAALFDSAHHHIAGDLRTWPEGLVVDGHVHELTVRPNEDEPYVLRILAVPVAGDRVLVLGRGLHMIAEWRLMMRHSLLVSIVPTVLFALLCGIVLSHRALGRVARMHEAIDRIMDGDLHERLPAGRQRDEMQRLAGSVNRMLDRLEHLMGEIRDVGNDIAHDLRTPLDRALAGTLSADDLRTVIARAIDDLDQCFSVITALLRIAEIENARRRVGFAVLDLNEIAADIVDLYEPIAEGKQIRLELLAAPVPVPVHGDRDLLIEVLANLIDNALKFTDTGGDVTLATFPDGQGGARLEVADTGIGIMPQERQAVLNRFYRSDKSRHVPGSGLGLSLVSAILRLHNAHLSISSARRHDARPGALFGVVFPPPAPVAIPPA
ncbi:two component sensor histidine kinase [Gluconacetobacter sacchari DSM 12717]|uniref:histidine kinase n=2 Tax=Gluconacetobacter sacchari TaxID=92759 RepID=A0A7W4IB31_9PROT|nr:HAMP domain-containing sensor histidine kinase [Gluconacetobacter sacchari]MBB2159595.1 HAMP domain-containing histidine kinase [Gluconacetobacter sacchari]GBQ25919.1 two component sensor histidine kinase [Gluconacetobacter sacchari DSM 12717]